VERGNFKGHCVIIISGNIAIYFYTLNNTAIKEPVKT
jgi:hypothetical protein